MEISEANSILIVKPSSLGDVVHTLPVLPILKANFPEHSIRWFINPEWAPLLKGHPLIDELVLFPRGKFRGVKGFAKFIMWGKELKRFPRQKPEVALDFQGLFRSGLISKLRGCEEIIGFSDARECGSLFYTKKITPPTQSMHAVDRYLYLLEQCGLEIPEHPEFVLPEGSGPEGVQLPEEFVLLHPFARGSGKALSAEKVEKLVELLAPAHVVFVGRSEEQVPEDKDRILNLVNKTSLQQLAWVCRKASAIISMDSGPMHIASAVAGDRVLGIHTWTDTRKVGPYHPEAKVWKAGRIDGKDQFTEKEYASNQSIKQNHLEQIAEWALAKL